MKHILSLSVALCLFSFLTCAGCSTSVNKVDKEKLNESEISNMTYEIYPTPHEIKEVSN